MDTQHLKVINNACFRLCLATIGIGAVIGICGIWGLLEKDSALYWKLLNTCGALFVAALCGSSAIACFVSNEKL